MSRSTLGLPDDLHAYLLEVGVREHPVLAELRETTGQLEMARMQISAEQGALMQQLVRLSGARRGIEVGTFTGYSALAVALAMPSDGKLVCCDVSAEWTAIGEAAWSRAGVREKLDLRLAPAMDTLDALIASDGEGSFDFAFVDADKENYDGYLERCLVLVRSGGMLLFDNTLWGGSVIDENDETEATLAIRALNTKLATDERVHIALLPVGDGLTLALKR